jgi:hypothetical protein
MAASFGWVALLNAAGYAFIIADSTVFRITEYEERIRGAVHRIPRYVFPIPRYVERMARIRSAYFGIGFVNYKGSALVFQTGCGCGTI